MNRPEFASGLRTTSDIDTPPPGGARYLLLSAFMGRVSSLCGSPRARSAVIDASVQLIVGESGAQDAQRLHVGKLAPINGLARLFGFIHRISFFALSFWAIELIFGASASNFLLASIDSFYRHGSRKILQDELQGGIDAGLTPASRPDLDLLDRLR